MSENPQGLPLDLVLGAYGDDTPCVFQLTTEGCEKTAKFIFRMKHTEDQTRMCGPESLEWTPACEDHMNLIRRSYVGFWADLVSPPPCSGCGKKLYLDEVKPI